MLWMRLTCSRITVKTLRRPKGETGPRPLGLLCPGSGPCPVRGLREVGRWEGPYAGGCSGDVCLSGMRRPAAVFRLSEDEHRGLWVMSTLALKVRVEALGHSICKPGPGLSTPPEWVGGSSRRAPVAGGGRRKPRAGSSVGIPPAAV